MKNLKRKWLIYSVAGLVLVGAGISIVGEANVNRIQDEPWFWLGTLGLVLLNSGISFVGEAVVYRVSYLQKKSNTTKDAA